jgi:hypothetical protein
MSGGVSVDESLKVQNNASGIEFFAEDSRAMGAVVFTPQPTTLALLGLSVIAIVMRLRKTS